MISQTPFISQSPISRSPKVIRPMSIMYHVYGSMKDCHGLVEDKIQPEKGGILTKLVGCSYLFKGNPNPAIMGQLKVSKDASWILLDIFKNKWVLLLAGLIYLISRKLAKKCFVKVCDYYFRFAYNPLRPHLLKGDRYSVFGVEIFRVSEKIINEIKDRDVKDVSAKLRNIALMIVDVDTAYRFVAQDIIPEINPENLKKDIVKEIRRIFSILDEREETISQRNKWKKVEKGLIFLLKSKKVREWTIKFIDGLDYERIKLDEADWYFCLKKRHYDFRGISAIDRVDMKEKIDREKKHTIPKLRWVKEPTPHMEITN